MTSLHLTKGAGGHLVKQSGGTHLVKGGGDCEEPEPGIPLCVRIDITGLDANICSGCRPVHVSSGNAEEVLDVSVDGSYIVNHVISSGGIEYYRGALSETVVEAKTWRNGCPDGDLIYHDFHEAQAEIRLNAALQIVLVWLASLAVARRLRMSWGMAFLRPLTMVVVMLIAVHSVWRARWGQGTLWKGRSYQTGGELLTHGWEQAR